MDGDLSTLSSMASRYAPSASRFISWVSGRGDYKIASNSILTESGAPPSFSRQGDGFRVRHREYISDVISQGAPFTSSVLPINPGLDSVFPWLAAIAQNFEQYKFNGLLFEYRTLSAVAVSSTNTALGAVVLATNYDPYDAKFPNKQTMEAYEFSCSGAPCYSLLHPIECAPRQTSNEIKYVRVGTAVPPGGDLRQYDMGNFQIATVGQQAVSNIGELWVTYDITFFKPKLLTSIGGGIDSYQAFYTGSVSTVSDFVTATIDPESTLTVTHPTPNSLRINQNGRFIITYIVTGTTVDITSSWTASAGGNIAPGTVGGLNNLLVARGTNTNVLWAVVDCIGDATGPGGTFSKTFPTTFAAFNTATLMVSQVPVGLSTGGSN